MRSTPATTVQKRPVKIKMYVGLDIIIRLKFTTIFHRCAILNVLNYLTKNPLCTSRNDRKCEGISSSLQETDGKPPFHTSPADPSCKTSRTRFSKQAFLYGA